MTQSFQNSCDLQHCIAKHILIHTLIQDLQNSVVKHFNHCTTLTYLK